jgi:DNA-binding MarR family transcriptional regulator
MSKDFAAALSLLFDETAALFHRLRSVAAELHRQGELSAGRRGILRSVERSGPQTVPQLARARPVSRQHIQIVVNGLLEDGLVTAEENPAHRRSSLIRLTPKGSRELQAMQTRECRMLSKARIDIPEKQIQEAATTLESVRRCLESKDWRKP